MSDYLPAKRYADALFELGRERKELKSIVEDIKHLTTVIKESPVLTKFFESPAGGSEKRRQILQEIFKDKIHPTTYTFILFLEEKRRLNLLKTACTIFHDKYLEHHNIQRVKITSRSRLDKEQIKSISQHLENRFQKTIEPQEEVDEEMVGGITIQAGDSVYDYSVRAQLERFRERLLHTL